MTVSKKTSFRTGKYIVSGIITLFGILLLISLFLPSVSVKPVKGPHGKSLVSSRNLWLALDSYRQKINEKGMDHQEFPNKLDDLVVEGILKKEDYQRLTDGLQISYFPPSSFPAALNHIILIVHVPNFVVYTTIDGQIHPNKIGPVREELEPERERARG
jgi:hypothetical protein